MCLEYPLCTWAGTKVYTAVLSSRSVKTNDIKFSRGRLSEGKGRQTPSFNICWLLVEKEEALVHLCVLDPLSRLIQSSDEQDSHIGHAGADSHSRNAQVIRLLQRGKSCPGEDAKLIERAPVVAVVTVILATSGWLSGNVPGSPLRQGHQAEALGPRQRVLLGIRAMPVKPGLWQKLRIGKTGW